MLKLEPMSPLKDGHPRFWVLSGTFRIGTVELFNSPSLWVWRLTKFYADIPDDIRRSGSAKSRQGAVSGLDFAWKQFQDFADMWHGTLTLKRQEDLQAQQKDYFVYAGQFLIGRITEDRLSPSPGWSWNITSMLPARTGRCSSRDVAMSEFKRAWLAICQSAASPGTSDSSP